MSTEIATDKNGASVPVGSFETALIGGDLAKMAEGMRLDYYKGVCDSLGVNYLTRPFDYIMLNGKLTLYANRGCADQLRKIHGVSLTVIAREVIGDLYSVSVRAQNRTGRVDESTGVVALGRLTGDARANALMKAETKAKRRATLSICGLGWLDESEIETIPGAQRVAIQDVSGPFIATPQPTKEVSSPVQKAVEEPPPMAETVQEAVHEVRHVGGHDFPKRSIPTKPPSDKQIGFLEKLMMKHNLPQASMPDVVLALSGYPEVTSKNVSKAIDALANAATPPDSVQHLVEFGEPDEPSQDFQDDDVPF